MINHGNCLFKSGHKIIYQFKMPMLVTVCDETQNLNETESKTFFRYQIFSIPNPILFCDTNFFPIPIPILFSIPKKIETDTNTFIDTKNFRNQVFLIPNPILFSIPNFFRYQYRYFFRYQILPKPIPKLFPIPKFIETDTDTFFDTNFFSKPIPIP